MLILRQTHVTAVFVNNDVQRRREDIHHHVCLFEVVKRNRQHTVEKIDVGIYMDIHTHTCRLNTFIYTVDCF